MRHEAISIQFNSEEMRWIQSYAEARGSTFSEVIREAIFEKIEDLVDAEAYEEVLREDDGARFTMDQVMEMSERMP